MYGGSDILEYNEIEVPKPSENQVLIEVHAAGVNPSDWKIRDGLFKTFHKITFPAVLGGDLSGTISQTGANVADFKVGDKVYARTSGGGAFAEYASTDAANVALKPDTFSFQEAAALPLVGLVAWEVLDKANVQQGSKVLIHGGAGGAGAVAVQLAKYKGASVAATAGEADLDFVKNLGASVVIDYKKEKFESIISKYDAVIDTVGSDTHKRSYQVLRKGGILVSMVEPPDAALMQKHSVEAFMVMVKPNGQYLAELAKIADEGKLKISVDKVFSLRDAGGAMDYLQNEHVRGKIVLSVK